MLKFLDNRTHQKLPKSPKKFLPEMLYGISAEAPQNFQTPHTIVHQSTYVSPYIKFQDARRQSLNKAKSQFQPEWTKKINLQLIEEQKITSGETQKITPPQSRYLETYHEQLNNRNSRFRISKGQFTNFIQKNNHYKVIGPLHGQQRNQDRIEDTKKSVWLKPDLTNKKSNSNSFTNKFSLTKCSKNSMEYSTYFDAMRQSINSDNQLIKTNTSLANNSKLISEKSRIRNNRDLFNTTFQRELFDRKKSSPYHQKFQLPKLQSEIIVPTFNSTMNKIRPGDRAQNQDEIRDQGMESLDQFEVNLWKKFK